ncbi:hypothetical protein BH10PAT2_BH10PAT2_0110 [soil metagenome]
MKKLSLLTLRISILLIPLLFLMFAPVAHAQTQPWLGTKCVGTKMSIHTVDTSTAIQSANPSGTANGSDVATIQGFGCLVANVLVIVLTGLGLIGFVMFIVGAFIYMLSGGNAKGTENAKNTITYAVIGIVVALSAFIILKLISSFTGVSTILNFTIPDSNSGIGGHAEEQTCLQVPNQTCVSGSCSGTQTFGDGVCGGSLTCCLNP